MVHPWDEIVYIIQKIITCEGQFSIVYLYHIKLLQHLRGDCEINMPHFLLQSLSKMAKAIQRHAKDKMTSLFHYGVIKIIITHELQKQNMTWQEFLIHNQFEEQEELPEEGLKEEKLLMIAYPKDG